jgi:hypothetical protein
MTIWLLALVLMASLGALGYRQGALRVAFSLAGILLGAFLAGPLGKLLRPGLSAVGVKNPVLLWLLAPLVVFVLFSIVFKVAALAVHQKVDVHFKYKAGDLRTKLWERMNHRLGLCLGLVNAMIYMVLISFVIYSLSYWTVQMASDDSDPKLLRIFNRVGRDLQSSGFTKVAKAVDPMPSAFYDTGDIVGLLYNNSLLEARLSQYPGFLALAERQEFQDIATDKEFTEMRQRREPIASLIHQPRAEAIINNPDLLRQIWETLVPDLADFQTYLETGKSPKYDPITILGRWRFNVNLATSMMRQIKPNITSSEMLRMKRWMLAAFSKTSLVAMTDHQAILKNIPQLKLPAATPATPAAAAAAAAPPSIQNLQGQWKDSDGKYMLTFVDGGRQEDLPANVEGERLLVKAEGFQLAFDRQD